MDLIGGTLHLWQGFPLTGELSTFGLWDKRESPLEASMSVEELCATAPERFKEMLERVQKQPLGMATLVYEAHSKESAANYVRGPFGFGQFRPDLPDLCEE